MPFTIRHGTAQILSRHFRFSFLVAVLTCLYQPRNVLLRTLSFLWPLFVTASLCNYFIDRPLHFFEPIDDDLDSVPKEAVIRSLLIILITHLIHLAAKASFEEFVWRMEGFIEDEAPAGEQQENHRRGASSEDIGGGKRLQIVPLSLTQQQLPPPPTHLRQPSPLKLAAAAAAAAAVPVAEGAEGKVAAEASPLPGAVRIEIRNSPGPGGAGGRSTPSPSRSAHRTGGAGTNVKTPPQSLRRVLWAHSRRPSTDMSPALAARLVAEATEAAAAPAAQQQQQRAEEPFTSPSMDPASAVPAAAADAEAAARLPEYPPPDRKSVV